jgi:HEAT repeat protein
MSATVLTLSFITLLLATAVSAVLVVAARGIRLHRERRAESLGATPRRLLLSYLAEPGEAGELAALSELPTKQWRAVQPGAIAMLAKVRGEARDALAALFQLRGATEQAMADLDRRGTVRRARAAELLGSLRQPQAVPVLADLLGDRHWEVRHVAIRALGRIGDASVVTPLLNTLIGDHPAPAHLVAHALAQLDPGATPELLRGLDHPDERVRAAALDTLRLRGAQGAEERGIRVLSADGSTEVRTRAAAMLGRVGTGPAVEALIVATGPGQAEPVRVAAARALGELGHPEAVPALVTRLDDPVHLVAQQAGAALARLGGPGLDALRERANAGADPAARLRPSTRNAPPVAPPTIAPPPAAPPPAAPPPAAPPPAAPPPAAPPPAAPPPAGNRRDTRRQARVVAARDVGPVHRNATGIVVVGVSLAGRVTGPPDTGEGHARAALAEAELANG